MKIRFAFYKAQWNKPVDALIAGWTWFTNIGTLATSHVEIGFMIEGEWKYFSSTTRGGSNGARWIKDSKLFKHPERWEILEGESMRPLQVMLDDASGMLGSNYDWLGIAGFATITGRLNSKKNWYCSEACHKVWSSKWIKRVSPRKLWKLVKESGFINV